MHQREQLLNGWLGFMVKGSETLWNVPQVVTQSQVFTPHLHHALCIAVNRESVLHLVCDVIRRQ